MGRVEGQNMGHGNVKEMIVSTEKNMSKNGLAILYYTESQTPLQRDSIAAPTFWQFVQFLQKFTKRLLQNVHKFADLLEFFTKNSLD